MILVCNLTYVWFPPTLDECIAYYQVRFAFKQIYFVYRKAAYDLHGKPTDNQTATCHVATLVVFSLVSDFKRNYIAFSIQIQPQQEMWNMCLLVCTG